jgi:hypothetical protein
MDALGNKERTQWFVGMLNMNHQPVFDGLQYQQVVALVGLGGKVS